MTRKEQGSRIYKQNSGQTRTYHRKCTLITNFCFPFPKFISITSQLLIGPKLRKLVPNEHWARMLYLGIGMFTFIINWTTAEKINFKYSRVASLSAGPPARRAAAAASTTLRPASPSTPRGGRLSPSPRRQVWPTEKEHHAAARAHSNRLPAFLSVFLLRTSGSTSNYENYA